jgi:hypothetical protein
MYPVDLIVPQCPVQGHHGNVKQIRGRLDGDVVRHDILLLIECDVVHLVMVSHAQQISKAMVRQIKVSVTRAIGQSPFD